MRVVWVRLAMAIAVACCAAAAVCGEFDGPVSFVPWRVLSPGDPAPDAPVILYWIPSSPGDFKHSELLVSRPLTLYASRCVAMKVVRPDDSARIAALAVTAMPAAFLMGSGGRLLGAASADRGRLRVHDVERLVHDKLAELDMTIQSQLDDARKKARAGDRQSAIDAYRSIWSQRCLFPRRGREAERELKRLGVDP